MHYWDVVCIYNCVLCYFQEAGKEGHIKTAVEKIQYLEVWTLIKPITKLFLLPSGPVFTKHFRFRIKIRLKFQNEYFLDYFSLFVRENLIYVSIDMVNVVLDLKCIRLKYMLETINYNKVDPVIKWAQIFITVSTIRFTFSFIKKA